MLVIVDEFVPVIAESGAGEQRPRCSHWMIQCAGEDLEVAFGRSLDVNQSYVSLIEKVSRKLPEGPVSDVVWQGYAKLFGSYSAIAHSSLQQHGLHLVPQAVSLSTVCWCVRLAAACRHCAAVAPSR